jgi:hypothetical protein
MKNTIKINIPLLLGIILFVLIGASLSTYFITKSSYPYREDIKDLRNRIDRLEGTVDSLNISSRVTATMYHPVRGQTDDTPNQLADGTYIRIERASQYNYIAVSRDLLRKNGGRFEMGDLVFVLKAGHKSGVYQIRDKMNKRFKNRIDFLEAPNTPNYKYTDVLVKKVPINRSNYAENEG